MISGDTSPEAHAAQLAVYARLGPERRFALGFALSEQAREIALGGIRARHPELSREAALRVLWRKLLGAELFTAAFPS